MGLLMVMQGWPRYCATWHARILTSTVHAPVFSPTHRGAIGGRGGVGGWGGEGGGGYGLVFGAHGGNGGGLGGGLGGGGGGGRLGGGSVYGSVGGGGGNGVGGGIPGGFLLRSMQRHMYPAKHAVLGAPFAWR